MGSSSRAIVTSTTSLPIIKFPFSSLTAIVTSTTSLPVIEFPFSSSRAIVTSTTSLPAIEFPFSSSRAIVTYRYCSKCKVEDGVTIDETFRHGCYDCPHVKKHYRRVARIFGFSDTNHLTYKDTFIWKKFFIKGAERDHNREIFFKFINMHIYAELSKTKKYGNQPTTHSMVSTICGEIIPNLEQNLYQNCSVIFLTEHFC